MSSVPAFRPYTFFWLQSFLLLALFSIIAYYLMVDQSIAKHATREGGLIDFSSAISYLVCAGLMIVLGGRQFIQRHYALIISVLVLGLRELDFDKRFSTLGLFKTATFRSAEVSLLEKSITLVIVLMVIWLAVTLIVNYLLPLIKQTFKLNMVALSIGCAGGLLVAARVLDGIGRKLASVGIDIGPHTEIHTTVIEEVFELGAPLSLIVALLCYVWLYRPSRDR